jgi:hypothetical protein
MTLLTQKQQKFVDAYVLFDNGTEAARRAGYSVKTARVIAAENLTKPAIQEAIRIQRSTYAVELQVTKDDVIAGMLCAIDLARKQQDPSAIIQGCAALAKLCGFYEPERESLDDACDVSGYTAKFAAMTDAELLDIARGSVKPQFYLEAGVCNKQTS